MATNPYFKHDVKSEQDLYEDLVIESLKMYGQDVYYLPRDTIDRNTIFSDEVLARFERAYKVEMYIENTEGFDGEGDLFTKFGVEIRDAANFILARRRWKTEIGRYESTEDFDMYRPREGDLIHLPLSNSTFEITKVEDEVPFYQLNNLPTFRLTCELFEYAEQDFDTGIDKIDNIEKAFSYQYKLLMGDSADGYIVGETVSQTLGSGAIITGEVQGWFDSSNELFLAHVGADDGKYHEFITTAQVIGDQSGAASTPSLIEEEMRTHPQAQNDDFDLDPTFFDFSESNPFGDPE